MKGLINESEKEFLSDIGGRIKEERYSLKMSQKELAMLSGCSRGTIVNLEAGKDVSVSTLLAAVRVLRLEDRLIKTIGSRKRR